VSQFYRITFITDATHLTIFPAYQNTGGAGLTCKSTVPARLLSRGELLFPQTELVYYAGNARNPGFDWHDRGRQRGHGRAFHGAADRCRDRHRRERRRLLQSFLLYGDSSSISWSVAGFPTATATGFQRRTSRLRTSPSSL
jgi:hypothetical protein